MICGQEKTRLQSGRAFDFFSNFHSSFFDKSPTTKCLKAFSINPFATEKSYDMVDYSIELNTSFFFEISTASSDIIHLIISNNK